MEERVRNMKIKQFINDILYGKYYLNRDMHINKVLNPASVCLYEQILRIVMTVIILFFAACAAYAIYGETQSIKEALTLCGLLIVALVLLIVDAIINSFNYKTEYKINDLKLIEAAMTGNIASIITKTDAGARSTLVYYIVETKTSEKIITRNGLIKPTIHNGDATETTFDLDKLELNVYM